MPGAARSSTPLLDKYGRDLTALAHAGKLSEAIGRKAERDAIVQALMQQDRNCPVLVGEAGVGKTAIVEGLAARLANPDKPLAAVLQPLRDARIVALNVADVVAGAVYRGEFEERVQGLLRECRSHREVILFIDEIHTLRGAGHSSTSQDAAQLFKQAISSGELRLIGATTADEYDRFIAGDSALERRMQPIRVAELSSAGTEALLRRLQPRLEASYHLTIQPEALSAAVALSVSYLADRRLPDKALALLHEACSYALLAGGRSPDAPGALLGQPPADPTQSSPGLMSLLAVDADPAAVVVTPEIVATVLARRLGLPVAHLTTSERDRLLNLEHNLRRLVVGQETAITAVARILRISRSSVADPHGPLGVILFAGPTGVGKTQTARAIAEVLFGGPQHLKQLDMAEYAQEHMAQQLIGAPPSFVGYDEGGTLTTWLRDHPYSVVLLDEFEKAHPAVRKIFLGLFEDGQLTDARGRTFSGRHAIYIMTSNWMPNSSRGDGAAEEDEEDEAYGRSPGAVAAAAAAMQHPSFGPDPAEASVRRQLGKLLPPELVNRIDHVVVFQPLTHADLRTIAAMQINRIQDDLEARFGVSLRLDETALDWLVTHGTDTASGARALARLIDRELRARLATLELEGRLTHGARITAVAKVDHLDIVVSI